MVGVRKSTPGFITEQVMELGAEVYPYSWAGIAYAIKIDIMTHIMWSLQNGLPVQWPETRTENGRLVVPGETALTFKPGTPPDLVTAWTIFMEGFWNLLAAYGEYTLPPIQA